MRQIMKIHRLTDNGYLRAGELSREAGDTLTTPLLPDFQLLLAEIFE
jgi:hypothetical protein